MKKTQNENADITKKTYDLFPSFTILIFGLTIVNLLRWPMKSPEEKMIKIQYIDGGHYFVFFEPALRRSLAPYEVLFGTNFTDPDVLVYSVFGVKHASFHNPVKLLFLGEAWPNIVISSEAHLTVHCLLFAPLPRMRYFPLWASNFGERKQYSPSDLVKRREAVDQAVTLKVEFCAFMYSHSSSARDRLFDIVAQWDDITSFGKWRNSGRMTPPQNDTHTAYDIAVAEYGKFKFVIAAENRQEPGYVTEKIINAMLAYSIPIYWGAKDISHHFNPKSFLNAMDMTEDQLVAEIARLDEDPAAYREMLEEPWFVGNTLPAWFAEDVQDGLFYGLREKIELNMRV